MKTLVFLGGPEPDVRLILRQAAMAELIVCADRGAQYALRHGIKPNVILGDMDSISPGVLDRAIALGVPIQRVSAEKDETDAQLAVDWAADHGATEMVVLCGMGRRLDHTLANVQLLLRMAKRGIAATLLDEHNTVRIMTGVCEVQGSAGSILSILPMNTGVTASDSEGLYYPLPNKELPLDTPFAVSNKFTQTTARFTISGGYAIVIQSQD